MTRAQDERVAHSSTAVSPSPFASDPSVARRHVSTKLLRPALWLLATAAVAALSALLFARTRAAPPIRYETAKLDRGPIEAKVAANGALSALVTVSVGSQVSGRIASLHADFGSRIRKGQVVATIEPSMLRAAVQQARANHAAAIAALERSRAQRTSAERQFLRIQQLYAQHMVAAVEYDAAEANAGMARAEVRAAESSVAQTKAAREQAELNLRYATIVSPIDGVVISRNVDVGQTVAATLQAPVLFTIAQDLTHMQVDTSVAEADVGKIRAGMPVSFSVDAYPDRTFAGQVRQVRDNAQTIQNVVTYDAVIDVENGERLLKPGMTASVTFVYARKADVVRVPNAALRFRPEPGLLAALHRAAPPITRHDERVLWVLRGTNAVPVRVRVGITDGKFTELLDVAAHPGELAVTEAASGAEKPSS